MPGADEEPAFAAEAVNARQPAVGIAGTCRAAPGSARAWLVIASGPAGACFPCHAWRRLRRHRGAARTPERLSVPPGADLAGSGRVQRGGSGADHGEGADKNCRSWAVTQPGRGGRARAEAAPGHCLGWPAAALAAGGAVL